MTEETLKQINELMALYELEASVKDIYVEGLIDRDIIRWFLRKQGLHDISVFTIDVVNIPDALVAQYGLHSRSKRSKVIALSYELAQSPIINANVLCIVDRDYEDFIPSVDSNDFLTLTDFNSIESYLIDNHTLDKFFTIVLGHLPVDCDILMAQIKTVLKKLFFIRLANELLLLRMEWVSPRKYIKVQRDSIIFEEEKFIDAYLLKNGKATHKNEFITQIREQIAKAPDDERRLIRGHDLVEILHFISVKLKNKRDFGDSTFFGGAFLGCLEALDMTKYSLFQSLLSM